MSASSSSSGPLAGPVVNLGDDPVAALEAASWALAAVIGTLDDAADRALDDVLEADPPRTAVLESVGLVRREGGRFVAHPSLVYADGPTSRSAVAARVSALRQVVAAATGGPADRAGGGWADQDDEVLLDQGRASAMTGRALATRLVPALPGLAERLAGEGGRVLDVGTGVAALALALARELPGTEVVGIDIVDRVLDLARKELADAGPDAARRITLRHQDVSEVTERDAYDLVWLPAPFLAEGALTAAVPRLVDALRPGGWIVVGTNPAATDPLRRAVSGWNAVRNGGNSYDTERMTEILTAAGLTEAQRFPTVPGGPVLVAARCRDR
ncbi:class I SAM-dependent methyltransferase [Actinacidiphila rubida]|uniref:Methyltransferase domain-containing protein n=1 Tax=Actinacidiphila rubida TaxID=310780 RepID=A0A1H8TM18_9ACTN|nr:class I SAM-dependent methyltransferase [Actinacidiphila rubida]SEO91895.1 Methyltransferase domain-containing protein [Actinacidiphila rubida]